MCYNRCVGDKSSQMLTLRLPSDLAHRLNAKAPAGGRSAFVVTAIERALGGEPASYTAGLQAGYRKGVADMYGRLHRVLELIDSGMDTTEAANTAFSEDWG